MHRYLAFVSSQEGADAAQAMQIMESSLGSTLSGWSIAFKDAGALVLHAGTRRDSAEHYPLAEQCGVIVGALFRRSDEDHTQRQKISFDAQETRRIVASTGQHLISSYWGRYFALIKDRGASSYHVIRDPTGAFTCYGTIWNGHRIYCSYIEDCARVIPLAFSVNGRHVVTHLMGNLKPLRETGLTEVEDIPGGERQSIYRGRFARSTLWHPAMFWDDSPIEDPETAARKLRNTVQTVINAWSSCHTNILHCLSGGLDSSIVAGCLARASGKPKVTCLNIFIPAGEEDKPMPFPNISSRYAKKLHRVTGHSDERQFARTVAERWGFPLIEQERRLADYSLQQVWKAPVAAVPSRFVQYLDQDAFEARAARENNASAVVNGLAGDELFYTTFQSIGVVDYVFRHHFGGRFLHELKKSCILSRESIWLVMYEAVKYGLLKRRKPDWFDCLKSPHLLSDDLVSSIRHEDFLHPWETLTAGLPPGVTTDCNVTHPSE